jgi:hypothetical protein
MRKPVKTVGACRCWRQALEQGGSFLALALLSEEKKGIERICHIIITQCDTLVETCM